MKTKTEYHRRKGRYEIINNKRWSRMAKDHRHFIMLNAYLKEPSKSNALKHLMKKPYMKYDIMHNKHEILLSIRLLKLSCHDEFKNMNYANKRIISNNSYGLSQNIYDFDI